MVMVSNIIIEGMYEDMMKRMLMVDSQIYGK